MSKRLLLALIPHASDQGEPRRNGRLGRTQEEPDSYQAAEVADCCMAS